MKALLRTASASLASSAVGAQMALADIAPGGPDLSTDCTLNGESVDCAQLQEMAGPFLALGAGIFIVFGILGIVTMVFWIMMLVHAATHDIKDKAMWIILMVFTGFIGAAIYYFVVKRHTK